MNLFQILGYDTSRPYSENSTTNVGLFALLPTGGPATITGNLAATEAQDTFSSSGVVFKNITGNLAATEAQDSLSGEGVVIRNITGDLAATESPDTLSGEGVVTGNVTGDLAATESPDTLSGEGVVTGNVTGDLAATEAPDTLSAEGIVIGNVDGTMAVTEAPDTMAAEGVVIPVPVPAPVADVGAEKRRIKKRDRDLEAYKRDRAELRALIEETVTPAAKEAKTVAVVADDGDNVGVVPVTGPQINIPVPPTMDAAEVAKMVAQAVQNANAEAIRVKAYKDAERALAVAKANLARIIKRRREEELLLLMD